MKTKKNKRLPNKPGLVNNKDRLLEIYLEQQERIAIFFNPYEHYSDCIKMLIELQKCAFTSVYFKSLNEFEQEDLQLRFGDLVDLVLDFAQPRFTSMHGLDYCFNQPLDDYPLTDEHFDYTQFLDDYTLTDEYLGYRFANSTSTVNYSLINALTLGYNSDKSFIDYLWSFELSYADWSLFSPEITYSAWQGFPKMPPLPEKPMYSYCIN